MCPVKVVADRKAIDYTSLNKRFRPDCQQAEQYFSLYNARLNLIRNSLIARSKSKWGPSVRNVSLGLLNDSLGNESVFIIGTLFKIMSKQPSILKEIDPQHHNNIKRFDLSCTLTNYASDEDTIVLHEQEEDVKLVGQIDIHKHVTGIPVALLGYQVDSGAKFHVTDICYSGPVLSVYRSIGKPTETHDPSQTRKVMLISGLEFGFADTSGYSEDKCREIIIALRMLQAFICGGTGDSADYYSSKISRIIIAGNSIASGIARAKEINNDVIVPDKVSTVPALLNIVKKLDDYLFTLQQTVDVDIMPGHNDPTTFLLPQQPFHPKLFPRSSCMTSFNAVTNPHIAEYDGKLFLGTSGQTIDAIRQFSRFEDSTTIIKHTLEWGHLAPSAPDNLSCVPFANQDPFIIDFTPDVYFAGNQPEFAVTTYTSEVRPKIQLISVPRFTESLSCVLVDLTTLDCQLMTFK